MKTKATATPATIALAAVLIPTLAISGPAGSETACADADFYAFLVEFQNTPATQKNLSADHIQMTTFQAMGSAMPARHSQMQNKDDLHWPTLPSLKELNRQDLAVKIYQHGPLKAELNADAMDGREVYFTWHFEKTPCWTFVGFTDGSLHR